MPIDISTEILIACPRSAVAAFMFDPKHDAIWTTGVIASRPHADGLLATGAKVERTVRFLGQQFSYLYEVTDAAPAEFVEMKVEKPFPMRVRYELEDSSDGTLARIRATGDATGFFRVAGPLLSRMVKRNIANDLQLLKDHLEARHAG